MNRRLTRQFSQLAFCAAFAVLSFVCFRYWSVRHEPVYKTFQREWNEDVDAINDAPKLPKGWNDIREFKIIGGNPETRKMLARVTPPLETKPDGQFRLEVLVVLWEEDKVHGALVQYDIEDLKTKNTVAEITRTLILDDPQP